MKLYGERAKGVLAIANRSTNFQIPICPNHGLIGAQVIFAIEQELAQNLTDICVGRLRLDQTTCRGLDCIQKVADLAGNRLDWTSERKGSEVSAYQNWVKRNTQFLHQLE